VNIIAAYQDHLADARFEDNVVNYVVTVQITDRKGRTLRPEMTAAVTIVLEPRLDVLAVPASVVGRGRSERFVSVLEKGSTVRRGSCRWGGRKVAGLKSPAAPPRASTSGVRRDEESDDGAAIGRGPGVDAGLSKRRDNGRQGAGGAIQTRRLRGASAGTPVATPTPTR
jgi:hypothetical protein